LISEVSDTSTSNPLLQFHAHLLLIVWKWLHCHRRHKVLKNCSQNTEQHTDLVTPPPGPCSENVCYLKWNMCRCPLFCSQQGLSIVVASLVHPSLLTSIREALFVALFVAYRSAR
jgi:hypothetical protein